MGGTATRNDRRRERDRDLREVAKDAERAISRARRFLDEKATPEKWNLSADPIERERQHREVAEGYQDNARRVVGELEELLMDLVGESIEVVRWHRARRRSTQPKLVSSPRQQKRLDLWRKSLQEAPRSTRELLDIAREHDCGCSPSQGKRDLESLEAKGAIARSVRGRQGGKLWTRGPSSTGRPSTTGARG